MIRSPNQQVGLIKLCPYEGCAFQCCDIEPEGAIVLYPGELDKAIEQGHSVEHLEIIGTDIYGGAEAICHAREKFICDSGHSYKPLDCASYPVWPRVERADEEEFVHAFKGDNCPLEDHMVEEHARFVLAAWSELAKADPRVAAWLVHYTNDLSNPETFSELM
jgi:hypothetical protein